MADLHAGLDPGDLAPQAGDGGATAVSVLFRARYPEMVRLAGLLGADDPEDIAQEAFARLIRKQIAETMGVSPGTVKSSVSRGLATLAVVLGGKA